jgi:hypothetical protein
MKALKMGSSNRLAGPIVSVVSSEANLWYEVLRYRVSEVHVTE